MESSVLNHSVPLRLGNSFFPNHLLSGERPAQDRLPGASGTAGIPLKDWKSFILLLEWQRMLGHFLWSISWMG